MTDFRTLIDLVARGEAGTLVEGSDYARNAPTLLINPNRKEMLKLISKSYDVGRMAIDDAGDVYSWEASLMTHADAAKMYGLVKTGSANRLTGLSLYALAEGMAARVYEVDDEQIHPELTELARTLPNITRIWGNDVVCIDMHGEP